MYDKPCAASIVAKGDGTQLWKLDRETFREILFDGGWPSCARMPAACPLRACCVPAACPLRACCVPLCSSTSQSTACSRQCGASLLLALGTSATRAESPQPLLCQASRERVLWPSTTRARRRSDAPPTAPGSGAEAQLDEHKTFLTHVQLLSELNDEELTTIADALKTVNFIPGDAIINEGDDGESMYVMLEGSAKATKTGVNDPGTDTPKVLRLLAAAALQLFRAVCRSVLCVQSICADSCAAHVLPAHICRC
jgi:hypothetical protein